MKKFSIIALLFCILSFSLSAYSGKPEVSGAFNFGTIISQSTNSDGATTIIGLPQLGITSDVRFKRFGIQFDFGFSWTNENFFYKNSSVTESTYTKLSETITLFPYYSFEKGNFIFEIGPLFGFSFIQTLLKETDLSLNYTSSYFLIITGGEIAAKYKISEHGKLFLQFPVIIAPYTKITEERDNQKTEYKSLSGSWTISRVYITPSIGIMYTF